MNVGPTADGVIPEPSIRHLQEIGKWLKVNGESLYGTKPWITQKEGLKKVEFINSYENNFQTFKEPEYSSQDMVFTSKGDSVYAVCLAWPEKPVTIHSFAGFSKAEIKSVTMLGANQKLNWKMTGHGLVIQPLRKKPCDHAFVYKIIHD